MKELIQRLTDEARHGAKVLAIGCLIFIFLALLILLAGLLLARL